MIIAKTRLIGSYLCVVMLAVSGCDSSDSASAGTGLSTSVGSAGDVVSTEAHVLDTNSAGVVELLHYHLRGVDQLLQESQAVVMIPPGDAPADGWPVLAWGHGTTGVSDSCAPSISSDLSGYLPYLNGLVDAGFAVVAPDYEGMGNAGSDHPYLNLDSAGRSMIYAVKAAVSAYPQLGSRFASIGHSQGGHAALGAAELAHELSPLNLLGAVAIAPASHLENSASLLQSIAKDTNAAAADRAAAGVGWLLYASYMLYGLEVSDASFDAATAYGAQGGQVVDAVEDVCASAFFAGLQTPVNLLLQTAGNLDSLLPSSITSDTKVLSYIRATEPGLRPIEAPVLILQGDTDTTVFPTFSQQLRETLIDAEVAVEYREFTANHSSIVATSATDAVVWLTQRFATP